MRGGRLLCSRRLALAASSAQRRRHILAEVPRRVVLLRSEGPRSWGGVIRGSTVVHHGTQLGAGSREGEQEQQQWKRQGKRTARSQAGEAGSTGQVWWFKGNSA